MAQAARSHAPNFSSVLDQPISETERPKPLPVGSYVCMVNGLPRFDKSSKKQTDFVEFNLQVLQAMEDVDEEDLDRALTKPSGEKLPLNAKSIRATYYITEDAMWRLKKFLTDLGFEKDDDRTYSALISEAPGRQVIAIVKHRASDDGEATFAELGGTASVDAPTRR